MNHDDVVGVVPNAGQKCFVVLAWQLSPPLPVNAISRKSFGQGNLTVEIQHCDKDITSSHKPPK